MVISGNQKIADIFIECLGSLVPKVGLAIPKNVVFATNGIEDPVLRAVHKYQSYSSILAIKEKYKDLNFTFSRIILWVIKKYATTHNHPQPSPCMKLTYLLKYWKGNFLPFVLIISITIDSSSSRNYLKFANVSHIH